MSWYDRDYAQEGPARRPGGMGASGYLWGGSIVTTLIIVNVAVYVLAVMFVPLREDIYELGALTAGDVLHGQVWRLITAQYLHAGTFHLFVNMIGLHFLGRPLEQRWSPGKFFAIYTVAGLFGNILFTVIFASVAPGMPAVGASGCIFGLLGIVAVLYPHATVLVYFLFPLRIRTAAFIFGGLAVLSILSGGPNWGGELCHLAGLVFGLWWAKFGEGWWSRPSRRAFSRSNSGRSRPSVFQSQVEERRADAELVDRILRKVYDKGLHSLSEAEKRALQEATERQRQREAQTGRVDRL